MNNTKMEDQALGLKELIDQIQEDEQQADPDELEESNQDFPRSIRHIDVLNLPPRKSVHGKNNQRTKIKVRRPAVRLLSTFIILLLILIVGYFYFYEDIVILFQ